MSISHYCIDRPIFASVISIVITLAGAVAMLALPVAQYPDITPPQITVAATYPGADAQVVANNVAAPIEQQVNGADNMIYMNSSSSATGNMTLNVFFEIGTDPALAQVDVQNRVNLALPQLPSAVQSQGIQVQKKSSAFMMVLAVYSAGDRYDSTYVANYANLYVLDALKRIPGANQASIFGTPDYAMRIWLKPDRMAQLGITAADVQKAVANQNQQFAVGRVGQSPTGTAVEQSFAVTTKGRLTEPSEFENIILRASNQGGAIVRLKDVGRAELGQKDYSLRSTYQGKPATLIAVYQQPGANALDVSAAVTKTLADMKATFPEGIEYKIVMDTTAFTRASISEVIHTFFEALVLVVIVVFLFLQSLRATLIPVIAVPVSIVGTFVGMLALGFSVNMLTLFGMVLAIGIVVDDAIVVIENVERNMHVHKMTPKDAAKRAMDEVAGPVVAIVLVLCAVFIPVAFMGGITGQLYKQFAITIAISVVISGLVALTLSPALAALLLKPQHGEKNAFFRWFERSFERMTEGYSRSVAFLIKRFVLALLLFAGMIVLMVLMAQRIPSAFLPPEDQGYLLGAVIMPDAASLDRTGAVGQVASDFFQNDPSVEGVAIVNGYSLLDGQNKNNAAAFFVGFKDFEERYKDSDTIEQQSAPAVIQKAARAFSTVQEGIILPVNPPSIPGLGTTGGMEVWVQSKGDGGVDQLAEVVGTLIAKAKDRPELGAITSTFNVHSRQLMVDVDREKAESLGVPVEDVYSAMQTMFGSLYVSQFNKFSRLWQVILQAEPSLPSQGRRLAADLRAQQEPGHGAAQGGAFDTLCHRARPVDPLQQLPRRQAHGQRSARLQHRPGPGGAGGNQRRNHDERLLAGPQWRSFRGEKERRRLVTGVHLRPGDGLPDPGGAIREVVVAGRRAAGRALCHLRRIACGADPRPEQRRVLPDRPDHAGGAGGEKRHPDLRVCRAQPRERHVRLRCRHDRCQGAPAPYRHDLVGIHPRVRAAGHCGRRFGKQPPLHRYRSNRRHARGDGDRGVLHPVVLLPGGTHVRQQGCRAEDH